MKKVAKSGKSDKMVLIHVDRVEIDDEDGKRKSKRAKIAPLAFWKNEKAIYNRRESGIILQNNCRNCFTRCY
jgi:hypothetical protein